MRKSKIFEPPEHIPAVHVVRKGRKPEPHEATLRNHHNSGSHEGTMDRVSREGHPDAHHLDTDVMGN